MLNAKIDYFDGNGWHEVELEKVKTWFSCKVDWGNVEDVREHGADYLEVNFKNGHTLYYKNVHGHYAQPVRFR